MGEFKEALIASSSGAANGMTGRGDDVHVLATAEATGGAIGMWEALIAPGTGPDWHTHTRETEVFRVLIGDFRFWCGAREFLVGPGGTVTLPPHIPHRWQNIGESPGLLLGIVTPGGFERMFLAFRANPPASLDQILAVEADMGLKDNDPRQRQ